MFLREMKIRLRTLIRVTRLAGRVVRSATVEPQDISEVLDLVNAHTLVISSQNEEP